MTVYLVPGKAVVTDVPRVGVKMDLTYGKLRSLIQSVALMYQQVMLMM